MRNKEVVFEKKAAAALACFRQVGGKTITIALL